MFRRFAFCLLLLLTYIGCGSERKSQPIAEGYVAPATLNLREELGPRQSTVATVKHGERLEIVGRRRRFVKVRTASGIEGWTDGRLLFTPEQMAELRRVADYAAKLPSQGRATVYGPLNVHTHPSRQAPSFHQLQEGDYAEVVRHRLEPRVPFQPDAPPAQPPFEGPVDDWSLIRTQDGKAGWVLFRMLVMAIPDEVAQYAEGHRITSYFSLGEVKGREETKHNWLWTTIAKGQEPYEFDSFRVFVWSLRRHRYETAYIERNLKGYYPVEVHPVDPAAGKQASPSFSLIVEDKDGQRYRRTYAFQGYRVRLISKTPWVPPPEPVLRSPPTGEEAEEPEKSFISGLIEKLRNLSR